MNMAHYIYEIKRNGIIEHTSPLFSSLEIAYEYFIEYDAPSHYGKLKFNRSHAVTASLFNKSTNIRVQFKKLESNPVPYGEWSDLCEKENVADD
jgi:hypothetical protein